MDYLGILGLYNGYIKVIYGNGIKLLEVPPKVPRMVRSPSLILLRGL